MRPPPGIARYLSFFAIQIACVGQIARTHAVCVHPIHAADREYKFSNPRSLDVQTMSFGSADSRGSGNPAVDNRLRSVAVPGLELPTNSGDLPSRIARWSFPIAFQSEQAEVFPTLVRLDVSDFDYNNVAFSPDGTRILSGGFYD